MEINTTNVACVLFLLAMVIHAFAGNVAMTIMNGFLLISMILLRDGW